MTAWNCNGLTEKPSKWGPETQFGFALIDGNPSTYWYSKEGARNYRTDHMISNHFANKSVVGNHTVAWMEFETFISGTPKSFTITCGPNTNNIPKNFRLLGAKERGAGQLQLWEELYYGRINDKLAPKNGATLTLPIQNPGTYKTYRIECSGNPIDFSLAEFKLNY